MDKPIEDNPYAPPIAPTRRVSPGRSSVLAMGLLAGGIGLILGWDDIHHVFPHFTTVLIWFYLGTAAILGGTYGARAWWAVLILGSSLCLVHMTAFAWGVRQPYVEEDMGSTLITLILNIPCLLSFGFAVLLRMTVRAGMVYGQSNLEILKLDQNE